MRTVERFAFFFGIANLILGVLAFFSPFVAEKRSGISRILPNRRNRSLINRRSGRLLGSLWAVNPPHAVMHTTLGAAGLATRPLNQFARAYMWLTAALFTALAVMGWTQVGFKPGIHNVKGIAIDWRDNILHTVWAAGALLLALRPNLGQSNPIEEGLQLAEAGLTE